MYIDAQQPAALPPRKRPLVPSGVLAALIVVVCEAMFFAGLVSAFAIVRSGVPPSAWPPPGQPRLPVESTALNTAALIASGVALWIAARSYRLGGAWTRRGYLLAMMLGGWFLLAQGVEWAALIREGLTMKTSPHGAFFYLIVGAHAAHVIAALGVLGWGYARLAGGRLPLDHLRAIRVWWTFVVAVWPVLYWQVYLA
jgi:cytochrome c oxidase subunit 3